MNDFDIVGWAGSDGDALCLDCVTHTWKKDNDAAPIFAGTEAEDGITCDECGEDIIEATEPWESSDPLVRAKSHCGDKEDDDAMSAIEELEAEAVRLKWAAEPFLIMHPALSEQFPLGIRVAVDTLAGDDPPLDEGLMFMFLAYVACVASVPMEELSVYELVVHEWEDGDWMLIT